MEGKAGLRIAYSNQKFVLFFQILEVMHEDLRNVTHSHALHALRQTPNRVKLVSIENLARILKLWNILF
jgi:hypothetical protein